MQTIVLIMMRRSVAQGFMGRFEGNTETCVVYEPDYDRAAVTVHAHHANAALVEVGETTNHDAAYCLSLCERLRQSAPDCKLALLCPEQDRASVTMAVAAKRDGRIDDFVFYDASLDYLTSKLLSML